MEFTHCTLDNGLTVIAEINRAAASMAIGFFAKTGSRDETPEVAGVSHFLEHMMFKGTARRSADDVNREFDEIGANYNAYTSQENTVYYAQVLPESLPRAVDLFGDMLRPALRVEDFEMEKKVILEEIGMYEDRPHWRLHDALLEKYFGSHSLGYRVLGTSDIISALTAEQMREYFNHWYSPQNITVSASGKVDFDALVKDVERLTGHWQRTTAARDYVQPRLADGDLTIVDEKLNRHYVAMISPGPGAQEETRYAAAVLSDVLGDSDGSRLYWALIDPGICDDADFSHHPQDQLGAFFADVSCDPERADQVEKILIDTIDNSIADLKDDEIERAKNKIATQTTVHGESTGGRMRSLGSQWTYLGKYSPLQDEIEKIMSITRDDILAMLGKDALRPRTIVRLGPGKASS